MAVLAAIRDTSAAHNSTLIRLLPIPADMTTPAFVVGLTA